MSFASQQVSFVAFFLPLVYFCHKKFTLQQQRCKNNGGVCPCTVNTVQPEWLSNDR
uniref:Uncharacterized protein n=1 Tax=Anguilla anguilla TaxID=7936 RepID=A0A0E9R5Z1_ANGAN